MDLRIEPGKLKGIWTAPPSKSAAHRIMIMAALRGEAVPKLDFCEDTAATYRALQTVAGTPALCSSGAGCIINCGSSGSTLRFMLPVVGALGVTAAFTGSMQLAARPLEPLLSAMEAHGCSFSSGSLPLTVKGKLTPGKYRLRGDVSSQFVSGLMMAFTVIDGAANIELSSPLESSGYVNMTADVIVRRTRAERPADVEGDWSAAANIIAANYLGADIKINGLRPDSLQPDRLIDQKLAQLGGSVDVSQCPDLAPILAVAAFVSGKQTEFTGTKRLSYKETNRNDSIIKLLDGLNAGVVDCMGDHRIAMAAAVGAKFMDHPVVLKGAECVSKSYPGFFREYDLLQ